eukprot:TRINITY_DN14196_c0_g9_i1.p1 TRINITY_DN14196_c0_g9~~TRINITY_DN14196_c0_g9_i1.p1  ORF type:complete len:186 (-),score=53.25 TRINITY_DN14196_c0_g9_i1:136-693(-)
MGCKLNLLKSTEDSKQETEVRFLLLGLDGAGKTTILNAITDKIDPHPIPTIGLNMETITINNISASFWDVSGSATVLWKHYYEGAGGVVYVIDSAKAEGIEAAVEELYQMAEDMKAPEVPLLILGNKQDVHGALTQEQITQSIDFNRLAKKSVILKTCTAATAPEEVRMIFQEFFINTINATANK